MKKVAKKCNQTDFGFVCDNIEGYLERRYCE